MKDHISVCTGTGELAGQPVITAENLDGYRILGVYPSYKAAHEALPLVKRAYRTRLARLARLADIANDEMRREAEAAAIAETIAAETRRDDYDPLPDYDYLDRRDD